MKNRGKYQRVERGIRRVTYVYDDNTRKEAGFEVRVGQTRLGMHPNITRARSARDRGLADADRGTLVAPSAGDRTVLAVAEMWLAGSQVAELKPSTRLRYTGIVNNRLSPLHARKVNKVTPAAVDAFKAGLVKEGLSPLTVRKVLFVLSFVMDTAKREGMVSTNPCTDALRTKRGKGSKPKAITIPEMDEMENLLDALTALDHDKAGEWALYAEVAAYAGLRAGEIAGLRVRCVDPLRRSVKVAETVVDLNGKTAIGDPKSDASHRTVTELPADLIQRLSAHVAGRSPEAYVFGDGTTPMRHKNYYRRVFLPTAKAVGLPGLRFHDLRHFYASDLLRDPLLSVKDVSSRMGHADPTLVLRTYGHLFADSGAGLAERVADRRAAARAKARPDAAKLRKIG